MKAKSSRIGKRKGRKVITRLMSDLCFWSG